MRAAWPRPLPRRIERVPPSSLDLILMDLTLPDINGVPSRDREFPLAGGLMSNGIGSVGESPIEHSI